MKMKSIWLVGFFIFSISNPAFSQKLYEAQSFNSDSLHRFLELELEASFGLEEFKLEVKKLGKSFIQILKEEYIRYNRGCMGKRDLEIWEEYILDFHDKLFELDTTSSELINLVELEKTETIKSILSENINRYEKRNHCQVLNSKVILYQDKKIKDATNDLRKFIVDSASFQDWKTNHNYKKNLLATLQLQKLQIVHFFQNYQYKRVREKWKTKYTPTLTN